MITKQEISFLKENPELITQELINELRNTLEGKNIQLELLDMPKDSEQYYLDQFGNRISFNGNRGLKNAYTQHALTDLHLKEIERCQEDIHYFKDNYIKIVTPKGVTFPTIRNYQNDFLTTVSGDQQDIVQLMPRQCCQGSTKLTVKDEYSIKEVSFKELLQRVRVSSNGWRPINLADKNCSKFKESYLAKGLQIFTNTGFKDIIEVHKTIPFRKITLYLSCGSFLECSEKHVVITSSGNEIHASETKGKFIKTQFGDSLVQDIEYSDFEEEMYDISINSKEELYYSNGILSHNSGKSVSTQMYLQWQYVFMKNINIGIVQNKGQTAREFLDKTKQIIINLPIWMQPGTDIWNKMSIQSDSGVKMLTDVPNNNQFRGYSINCLVVDEVGFINTNSWWEFQDSIFPQQSGLAWKKNILLSTQNGQNHFYDIVQGAREKRNGYTPFEIDWKDVPRYKSDGTIFSNEEFKKSIIDKNGIQHWNQNYQCHFLGSSQTLLNQETLERLKSRKPEYIRDNMLKIYEDPEAGEKYILTVDQQKDGSDFFTVNIFKITNFPFEQVQSQKLQVNYLLMPEYLLEWQESYNYQYVIIENNEGQGQSIQDVLYTEYEYENIHFDKKLNTKTRKNKEHPGFRTTKGNRPILLSTMQSFIEEDKLIIHDKDLIEEFKHFILVNNKYQADDGYHDDLVMGTSFLFVPFVDIKNFDGFKGVVDALFDKDRDQDFDFMDNIVFGQFDSEYEEETFPEFDESFDFE